jgi:hypothetical protein
MSTKPQIKIPDNQLETKKFFAEFTEKIVTLQKTFTSYNNLVVGVLVIGFLILVFSLATLLIQSWQMNSTFRNENNQLNIQSEIIKNNVEQQKATNDRLDKIEEKLNASQPVSAK